LTIAGPVLASSEVRDAIRVGDTPAEFAQVYRMSRVAQEMVNRYAPSAPIAAREEAAIRIVGYLYDGAGRRLCGRSAQLRRGTTALAVPFGYRFYVLVQRTHTLEALRQAGTQQAGDFSRAWFPSNGLRHPYPSR